MSQNRPSVLGSKNALATEGRIPRPPFAYVDFANWLAQNHLKKLAVEIGCGVGLHPIRWAQANPNGIMLAIERTHNKFAKFYGRLKNHPGLTNIFPAHADAALLLPHLNLYNKVNEIFVFYPNPYPKSRHKNLRFAYNHLTDILFDSLSVNGTMLFATNIENYANELRKEIPQKLNLKIVSDKKLSSFDTPRTHFEKKYLARHETCFELIFKKY